MLEKLNFNDLLRYGFCGGAFFIALALTRVGIDAAISGSVGLAESNGLALVALVLGSLIYSLHIALFQCPIAWLMTLILDRKRPAYKFSKYLFTVLHYDLLIKKNFRRDYSRWVRRCNYPAFQANFDKWASQVHFLYGSGWAILSGASIGRLLSHGVRGHEWYLFFTATEGCIVFYGLLILFLMCLFGALFQDYALYYYDRKLMTDLHSKPRKTPDALARGAEV